MGSMGIDLSPSDLGFPDKFREWRPNQSDAIARVLDSEARFVGLSVPTGGGKSLSYVAAALLSEARTVILTSTKALQTQLLDDFGGLGMVDIRGRANYQCVISPITNCEDGGYCNCSVSRSKPADCPYKAAYARATGSRLVVTNYPYWALVNKYAEGLGQVDMLVLDEAHASPDEVCAIMTVSFHPLDILRRMRAGWPDDPDDMDQWRTWAARLRPIADHRLDDAKIAVREDGPVIRLLQEVRHLNTLSRSLQTVANMRGQWVAEPNSANGFTLAPVWPAEYAEEVLFLGIPKIVLVSATIMPKTLRLLGAPDNDTEFYEYPSSFPPRRSPVYYVPTVKVNHRWSEEDTAVWLARIDQIISQRLDRRGVIHSVSYDRRDLILARSKYAHYMITHSPGSDSAMEQLVRFRNTPPPVIMLSPSMTTGVDLPFGSCEYIIICKVPFPDTRSKIVQARVGRLAPRGSAERDAGREYELYTTIQTLVQESGRGMRAADDQCEVLVVDNQIDWIERWHKHLIPLWWRRLFRRPAPGAIPAPPPPLGAASCARLAARQPN